jgi:hypothetical protein
MAWGQFPSLDAWRPPDPEYAVAKLVAGKVTTGQPCEFRDCSAQGRHFDWRGWRCDDHEPLAAGEAAPAIGGEVDSSLAARACRGDPTKRWPWRHTSSGARTLRDHDDDGRSRPPGDRPPGGTLMAPSYPNVQCVSCGAVLPASQMRSHRCSSSKEAQPA